MARRIAVALVVALIFSVAALVFFYKKISTANHPVVQPPLQYVAAARAIDPGETLKPEDLSLINWPRSNPLAGSFTRVSDVVGRAALYPVAAGQPILDQQLAAIGTGMGLPGEIPNGMRAIALRSDEVVGVAGFLMPGTHVDVLVTYRPTNDAPTPLTSTILQDVEVLAVGHQTQPDPSGKPSNVDVITLLLSPENAEKAVLAAAQGTIHFVLRNGRDDTAATTTPIEVSELSGPAAPQKTRGTGMVALKPKAPVKKPWVVETMLGNKRSVDSFD
ncbi:MAG TPA: Flp pilus assembly protein CpaB [Acidobacteriaceae bacterium]|nr:Flp pilus assembly protein CpaB [Acidobacteriaceae bacterium]